MAELGTGGQSYGQALPDQVEGVADFFNAQIEVISDVRDLYTARVALEREYATKLQVLTRKASEKKAKAQSAFVIGYEPTQVWNVDSLKQSTLDQAYEEIIKSMVNTSQDHIVFADALTSQIIDVLKVLEKSNEDAKKKEISFFQKLLLDRDRVYGDRLKSKQKYDEECAEVESFRQKQGRASDDRHADRAAKQAEQQRNDMLNSKNSYLISIAIANRIQRTFYQEDVPRLEDELQALHRRLVLRFVKILTHGQDLHLRHLDTLKSRISDVGTKLGQVDVIQDQDLFIKYNLRTFMAPDDWIFEPCSIHYDTDAISVEPEPKIYIQNKLRRSREKINELTPLMELNRAELKQLSSQVASYTVDNGVGAIDDLTDKYLEAAHQLALYGTSERVLTAEIDTIVQVLGDDEGAAKPHSFKSTSFSIPTQCSYCKSSIWGLSKQGKTCRSCGLSVHAKCELKVPANCEETEGHHAISLFKRNTTTSRSGVPEPTPTIAPSASSFVQSSEEHSEEVVQAKVLFDFTATSEFELGVHESATVHVVEADDGSGWTKVVDEDGNRGLVPASYLEPAGETGIREVARPEDTATRVRAIYPYVAQGPDELTLQPGDILMLSSGPSGGENYGDGWWEGYNNHGRKGIFPSNYVEAT
ncbi:hypothetical protein GALMADRAFT_237644 [Galerina marginata CBS 339.88]|uniref:SH3 domain-containing protein n=1 Tax=Galerina marginata (strain CBS 339.88) TaxID=685588 RepID=A0A067TGM4_GALM3|nr:hypothetical protein GALMADRAFT_237644 [Galerina marginata CBS 339.88]